MATIDELIASIEVEHEAAIKRRDKASAEAKAILSLASQEGRSNLTAEEDERIAQLFVARDGAKADAEARPTHVEPTTPYHEHTTMVGVDEPPREREER